MKVSTKVLKTAAILDFIIDVLLIVSLWVLVSDVQKLKTENKILQNEVTEQENQIIEKDNYIDYLEMVVEKSGIFND